MMTLILLLALTSGAYGAYRVVHVAPAQRYAWSSTWRLACMIAGLRISALWVGLTGLHRSDWLQIPGYFLLMLCLPDIYIVKAARGEPMLWAMLGTLTLAATSLGWSTAFLWFARRFRSKAQAQL
jgi:hypothetical protein